MKDDRKNVNKNKNKSDLVSKKRKASCLKEEKTTDDTKELVVKETSKSKKKSRSLESLPKQESVSLKFVPEVGTRVPEIPPEVKKYVSVANRLNPARKGFDPKFKSKWSLMTQKRKQVYVNRDNKYIEAQKSRTAKIAYPFTVNQEDHCETSPDAYRDIIPLLDRLARLLGKAKHELSIYDPYYCAGSVKRHLTTLRFPNVYNECEDFYSKVKEGSVPSHDVVVTNPPYGEEHVRRLLNFCASNRKPFLLCMPDYVCGKNFYLPTFTEAALSSLPVYLFPKSRYMYWTPHGLREVKNKKSHRNLCLGIRTSPFASFWYISLSPAVKRSSLIKWWKKRKKKDGIESELFDSIDSLPITITKS